MKILITGGTGFQGSHLTEKLVKKGHEVTVLNTLSEKAKRAAETLSPLPVHIIWGSITDAELIEKTVRDHEVVFHLGARINVDESIQYPRAYTEANIIGTQNVLEAARKFGTRMIHASTCEVYGAPEPGKLTNELTELRPHSPYAASKAGADRLCYAYYKTYGVPVSIVRPFNIYGERQKEGAGGAAIAIFVKKAMANEPIIIFGDGAQTRDYMNIDDLVQAYELMLDHPELAGEVINFGSGHEVSIRDIAEYISKKMNSRLEFRDPRPGEVKSFVAADITKAKKYGFNPTIDLWRGIDRYIDWRTKQPL